MMKFFKKNKKGFSLVELIVVIAILGILSAVVIPRVGESTERARIAHDRATLRTVQGAVHMFHAQHGRWPGRNPAGGYLGAFDPGLSVDNYTALGVPLSAFLDIQGNVMPLARSRTLVIDVDTLREFYYNPSTGAVTIEPALPELPVSP